MADFVVMMNTTIRPLGHLRALDGLRGVAILIVMVAHANHFVLQGGSLGVDIFFCLSGFLITSLLLQEWESHRSINYKAFYIRRGLRLFPALLILLGCTVIYACVFLAPQARYGLLATAASSLVYVTNWGQVFGWIEGGGNGLGHTWSLSIEEQFYLLWPLALACLLKLRARPWWIISILTAAIAGVAFERTMMWNHGIAYQRIYRGLDTRADSLLVGSVAGMIGSWGLIDPTHRITRIMLGILTFFSLLLLSVAIVVIGFPLTRMEMFLAKGGGFSLIAFSVGCILLWLRIYPVTLLHRSLEIRPLMAVGKISYGLYLWHWFIYVIIEDHLPPGGWKVIVGLKFGLSLVAAWLSYRYIETPFLKLKDRFTTSPDGHAARP